MEIDLDSRNRFSFTGELFGALYLSEQPSEVGLTAGITWAVNPHLDLSAVVIGGWIGGGPMLGLMVGVSPQFRLWH